MKLFDGRQLQELASVRVGVVEAAAVLHVGSSRLRDLQRVEQ